jgi:NAD(P)H-hydrate epimerase
MNSLPAQLYTTDQVRRIEQRVFSTGTAAATLMQRAGLHAYRILRGRWPKARRVSIACGPGNNGGDGYVIGALAAKAGLEVQLIQLAEPRSAHARSALIGARDAGAKLIAYDAGVLGDTDVVVDALLGIGLTNEPRAPFTKIIAEINSVDAPCLSVDIPSGLLADSGAAPGSLIMANVTATLIGLKIGLFTGRGPDCAGEVLFDDLGVGESVRMEPHFATRLSSQWVRAVLPLREASFHKGKAGHLLVVGGGPGMAGAAWLAGAAALRCGAGRVTIACHPTSAVAIAAGSPELMVQSVSGPADLTDLLDKMDAIVVGPGLGRDPWGAALLALILDKVDPSLLDADALNLLSSDRQPVPGAIVTPHPAEAARLLGQLTSDVNVDRPRAVRAISKALDAVCVLKGSGTLVCSDEDDLLLCDRGNPGMASAGMGDLLSGVIGSLCAQGLSPLQAAGAGTWIHSAAADLAAPADGPVGLIAGDLMPYLQLLRNCPDKADEVSHHSL